MSIYLTALLKFKAGEADNVKPLLLELVANSLKEKACLQYELYQDSENESLFIFHETWKDAAGLEQHTQQEHYKQFSQAVVPLLEEVPTLHKTQRIA